MTDKGGTKSGDPFDLEDILNLHDKLAKIRLARRIMGDDWFKKEIGKDPALMEIEASERLAESKKKLRELAYRCSCPTD